MSLFVCLCIYLFVNLTCIAKDRAGASSRAIPCLAPVPSASYPHARRVGCRSTVLASPQHVSVRFLCVDAADRMSTLMQCGLWFFCAFAKEVIAVCVPPVTLNTIIKMALTTDYLWLKNRITAIKKKVWLYLLCMFRHMTLKWARRWK